MPATSGKSQTKFVESALSLSIKRKSIRMQKLISSKWFGSKQRVEKHLSTQILREKKNKKNNTAIASVCSSCVCR